MQSKKYVIETTYLEFQFPKINSKQLCEYKLFIKFAAKYSKNI